MTAGQQAAREAIVLFAHGARDPRWAEPFERLRALLVERAQPALVVLAFLELMEPSLDTAVDALAAQGVEAIVVVPVFLGQGGHVRGDLPRLVDEVRSRHPALGLRVAPAVGEDEGVLGAIADYCARMVYRTAAP